MQDAKHRSESEPNTSPAGATSLTLLDQATDGDARAWQRLVLLYTPLMHWWCRRFGVYRPEDVEDVTQDVFATVAGKIGRFTRGPVGSFRSWLFTICRHKAGDHLRRTQNRPVATGDDITHAHLEAVPETTDSAAEPDEVSERIILVRQAVELVRQEFEPETWTAAWRAAVEGQTPADIAAALGMTVGAVYTAKSRVLKRLRDLLRAVPADFGHPALPK